MSLYRHTVTGEIRDIDPASIPPHKTSLWEAYTPPTPQPTADELRQAEIDAAITADSRIAQLKAMTNAQLQSWWNGLTTGQRNDVLFLCVKVLIRRVL